MNYNQLRSNFTIIHGELGNGLSSVIDDLEEMRHFLNVLERSKGGTACIVEDVPQETIVIVKRLLENSKQELLDDIEHINGLIERMKAPCNSTQ